MTLQLDCVDLLSFPHLRVGRERMLLFYHSRNSLHSLHVTREVTSRVTKRLV
jgi:hypothetical protein